LPSILLLYYAVGAGWEGRALLTVVAGVSGGEKSHRGTTLCRLVPFPEDHTVPDRFGFPESGNPGISLLYIEYPLFLPEGQSGPNLIISGLPYNQSGAMNSIRGTTL